MSTNTPTTQQSRGPAAGSVVNNTKRVRWAKESLLKALRKQDWELVQMYAEDITKLAVKLSHGVEDEKFHRL